MDLRQLRECAIAWSLFPASTLKGAIERLGFVQADPIRSPARAQDLILRHRVTHYQVGDLERRYALLELDEDILYAYGFLPRKIQNLLHPRPPANLSELERKILDTVRDCGSLHPKALKTPFGREKVINAWGGYSQATKCALEHLHYRGLLRIARRENGIRIYEAAPGPTESKSPEDRMRELTRVIATILAPVRERKLQSIVSYLRRSIHGFADYRLMIGQLLQSGELEKQKIGGVSYIWPAHHKIPKRIPGGIRFLAPFDPVVWERGRFEQLWGWSYRFEAYTPLAKRVRGYYAMPMLRGAQMIGWANVSLLGKQFDVNLGFVDQRPDDLEFGDELDAEIARMELFLKCTGSGVANAGKPT